MVVTKYEIMNHNIYLCSILLLLFLYDFVYLLIPRYYIIMVISIIDE